MQICPTICDFSLGKWSTIKERFLGPQTRSHVTGELGRLSSDSAAPRTTQRSLVRAAALSDPVNWCAVAFFCAELLPSFDSAWERPHSCRARRRQIFCSKFVGASFPQGRRPLTPRYADVRRSGLGELSPNRTTRKTASHFKVRRSFQRCQL